MNENGRGYSTPRTGVAVIVTHEQKVLFGKRIIKPEGFAWQLPGGWIETGESPEQTARREVKEETGLELASIRFVTFTNNVFSTRNHSISLYFEAECLNPEKIKTGERDKCEEWAWLDWQEVPDNLYLPLQLLKDSGYRPFLPDKYQTHV
ncbi:MAG: NUDIX domain-containing protein [Gammaproteobacteria bacterium]|nr:NUDIX domain-containing protein [Gammaproteobacteria bacterium]